MNIRNFFTGAALRKSLPFAVDETVKEHLLEQVGTWRGIYEGDSEWRYARKGGLEGGYRRVRSISAAQSLCSELAAL